jgi:hypothetical protein
MSTVESYEELYGKVVVNTPVPFEAKQIAESREQKMLIPSRLLARSKCRSLQ